VKVTIYEFNLEELKFMTTFSNLEQALEGLDAVLTGVEDIVAEEPAELAAKTTGLVMTVNLIKERLNALGAKVEAYSETTTVDEPPVVIDPIEDTPVEIAPELV
jgi:hypothetical protein